MKTFEFKDPFENRKEVLELVRQYGKSQDKNALESGGRLRKRYRYEDLEVVLRWKTARVVSRFRKDKDDEEILEALKVAKNAKHERTAIAVLCGLRWINIPMASAVMTCLSPKRYTVIDFRALGSLNAQKYSLSIDLYLQYLDFCIKTARAYRIPLRDYDRALWQVSKNKSKKSGGKMGA